MTTFICAGSVILLGAVILFFYLLNTARKKSSNANSLGKKQFAPVYISMADKPQSIFKGMDDLKLGLLNTEVAGDRWRWVPMFIFIGGAGLMLVDAFLFLLGYSSFVFVTGGLALWIASVIMARGLRKSDSYDFPPRFDGVRQVLYTLRDDLRPNTTFLGHLDLTGAMQMTKLARETKDARDRTTDTFRDEWLALKAKLYDGNVLRVSAIQKIKKRRSYWKRSRVSGKMKMKPEKHKGSAQFLKIRLAVNPEIYKIVQNPEFRQGSKVGNFNIDALKTQSGIIDVLASSPREEVDSVQILEFLRSTYTLLQRKAA